MAPSAHERLTALKQQIYDLEHRTYVLEFPPNERGRLRDLRRELHGLESELGGPTPDSPTWRQGAPPRDAFRRAGHEEVWATPDEVRSVAELRTFHAGMPGDAPDPTFVASATMPGVDVVATYEDGVLVRALLRGDGREGDDVTDNLRTLPSVPLRLRPPGTLTESRITKPDGQSYGPSTVSPVPPFPARLQVRLTVALRHVDLTALDRRRVDAGEAPYVDQRGAVLASLRRLDPRITAARRLRAFAVGSGPVPPGIDTRWQFLGALKSWGFAVQPITWRCRGLQEILDFVAALQQQAPSYEFPLEGGWLVVNRISATALPLEARLAFPAPGRPAVVTRVYHAVGRGGAILPVALVGKAPEHDLPVPERAPVPAVSGTATLGLAAGAPVRVRPGSVAPVLMRDAAEDAGSEGPTVCPACGHPLVRPADEPFARCVNEACAGRARARLLHAIGPRGLRLTELTVRAADRLIAERGPIGVADIVDLDGDQLERLVPGQGARLLERLQAARRMPLWRFVYLSAIPFIAEHEARLIGRHVRTVERLEALDSQTARIDGLAPEASRSLAEWLPVEGRRALARAKAVRIELLGDDEAFSAPFLAKTVVVAGKLEGGVAQLSDEVERRGGIIQSRVGRDTDLVVVGAEADKIADVAAMYGVPVVDAAAIGEIIRLTGAIPM